LKLAVIDNYDSFTYNLVHYFEKILNDDVVVFRNNEITIEQLNSFDKICISPGPGLPADAGITMEVIKHFAPTKSILGVCLGMQAMVEVFDGTLHNLKNVHHGVARKTKVLSHKDLFKELPLEFLSGRYHSWAVKKESLPDCFEITSVDEDKNVMSISHKTLKLYGVQFHPESVLTEHGETILKNWLLL
jgi:anthranilate synthase component II